MSVSPRGWAETRLVEIAEYIQRGKSPRYILRSEVPVINQKCVRWWGIDENYLKYVDPDQWNAWSEERFLRRGDILWNSTGTGTIGRACMFAGLNSAEKAVVDSHVTVVRVSSEMSAEYVLRFIQGPSVQGRISEMQSGSTNQVELSKGEVEDLILAVPPAAEQRRIVAKLNSLFARTKAARDELARIPLFLEHYKQAILAKAFSGELTADWRQECRDEPRHEQANPRLSTDQSRAKLAAKLDCRFQSWEFPKDLDRPIIPDGWTWNALGNLVVHRSGIAFRSEDFKEGGNQVIRLGNLYQGMMDLERAPVYLPTSNDYQAFLASEGDILISQTGTKYKRDYGHFVRVLKEHGLLLVNQRVLCISAIDRIYTSYLYYFSMCSLFRDYFFSKETGGVNQGNVGIDGVMTAPIPIPPNDELTEIVHRIDTAMEWLNVVAAEQAKASQLLDSLDQGVLAKGFRGELVPQDPSDEPAEKLLERIRAARGVLPTARRARRAKASA